MANILNNSINSIMEVDYVLKRDGSKEEMSFEKVLKRIKELSKNLNVNPTKISKQVCSQLENNMPTNKIDELSAQLCAACATEHPDYVELASRIEISNLHKNTSPSFSETIRILYENSRGALISKELYETVELNKTKLNSYIKYKRDNLIDYFGIKTLCKSYLLKINSKIIERPQHLFMRVSLGIHNDDLKEALKTYDLMSEKWFIHATPTLFNSGTPRPQLSSCFLLAMREDSIDGIYKSLRDCALISKWAGGIGIHVHNIRAKDSGIRGTNGISNGLVPMLRVFNNTARYVDQGGGKRNGSIAIYLEPWHADVFSWLLLRKNHGNEEERARDLFYALWIPDLFMKRVKEKGKWTLMCPDECPGLSECYGEEFEALYTKYEDEGRGRKTIEATELWYSIVESQIETGTPYLCYKDAANKKSNQNNLGTIKSSNLCTEIIEYSSPEEFAVCNLASIGLSKFVIKDKKVFDYDKLYKIVKVVTKNLNKIIDRNYYPVPETELSNKLHRPIGIGVQGLADVFALLKIPFNSDEAKQINEKIFETIYYGAMETSMELSKGREAPLIELKNLLEIKESNREFTKEELERYISITKKYNYTEKEINRDKYIGSYATFDNSPASKGLFQFDLWDSSPSKEMLPKWNKLKKDVQKWGIRNSLLVAPMPTASTSQILGNNECIEPFNAAIYLRRVLAGEFIVINKYLIQDLIELKLWNKEIKNKIIANNGSVQNIEEIPSNVKEIYKTVWELGNKILIDMAADRGKYICQSQSLNLFMEKPEFNKITSMHFYAWGKGLKTGQYYLRTKPIAQAQQFTIEPENISKPKEILACSIDNPDCEACGS